MKRILYAVAAMMLLMPVMAGAQNLKGSYFMDNSLTRNRLNPAFAPTANYLMIPVIGNTYMGGKSNMDINTYVYPVNGELYTFLNRNVTVEQLDAALPAKPYNDVDVSLDILNFGWAHGSSYWTVDFGFRGNGALDFSRDLFLFMKKGTGTSGTYDLGPVRFNLNAAFNASLGYSKDLSSLVPGLRIGAKARAILPLFYADVDMNKISLDASPEQWVVNTDAAMNLAINDLALVNSGEGASFEGRLDGFAGFGMSFDLGAEYKLEFDGFINSVYVSAAVTDLGFINYNAKSAQPYIAEGQMDWTGVKVSLEEGAMDGVTDELEEEFRNIFKFEKDGEGRALKGTTLPTFYLGVEMPFLNEMMSVGALYSARKSYNLTRSELMLSYNLTPARWFSAGVNYSVSNFTKSLGFIFELTPKKGPSLFVGSDYIPLEWAKAPENFPVGVLPMAGRIDLQFGLAFTFKGR